MKKKFRCDSCDELVVHLYHIESCCGDGSLFMLCGECINDRERRDAENRVMFGVEVDR